MDYRVISGTEDPGEAWDRFVSGHPNGHLMQSGAWAAVKRQAGWRPLFLHLEADGQIQAAGLFLERGLRAPGSELLYAPHGPVLDYAKPDLVEAFGRAIRQVARERGAFLVQADPAVPVDQAGAQEALEQMGFRRNDKIGLFRVSQPYRVMQIPLERYGGPEGLLRALPHKTRYNVRLAERKGVRIVPRIDAEACREFHQLLWNNGRAKGFPVRGYKFHEAIWTHCVQKGMGEYLFAYHEGKVLAAIQVLTFGSCAWYMYGASDEEDRNLMPTYLLQWTAIERAWKAGARCYDMRGIYSLTPQPSDPEYGVYDFKRKFNAELVQFVGEYDLVIRPAVYAFWSRMEYAAQVPAEWAYRLWQRARLSA